MSLLSGGRGRLEMSGGRGVNLMSGSRAISYGRWRSAAVQEGMISTTARGRGLMLGSGRAVIRAPSNLSVGPSGSSSSVSVQRGASSSSLHGVISAVPPPRTEHLGAVSHPLRGRNKIVWEGGDSARPQSRRPGQPSTSRVSVSAQKDSKSTLASMPLKVTSP